MKKILKSRLEKKSQSREVFYCREEDNSLNIHNGKWAYLAHQLSPMHQLKGKRVGEEGGWWRGMMGGDRISTSLRIFTRERTAMTNCPIIFRSDWLTNIFLHFFTNFSETIASRHNVARLRALSWSSGTSRNKWYRGVQESPLIRLSFAKLRVYQKYFSGTATHVHTEKSFQILLN